MMDSPAETTVGRLPNLVVIGVGKAGTTSLFEYLGTHPDICLSESKELGYFTPLRYGEPLAPLATYTQNFAHCVDARYAVEASPAYFYGGRAVARAMRETCDSLRVVLSLREPGDRCWSWFQFVKSRARIPRDLTFEDYLDRCEQLRREDLDGIIENQPFHGLRGGCYAEWLDDWIDEFGSDLHIVFFDELASDPRAVLEQTFDWLGLDRQPAETANLEAQNRTVQYRNRTAQRIAVSVNERGERFFRRHPDLKRRLRSAYYRLNRAERREAMSSAARQRMNEFYRPYNARLSDQLMRLGLDIPANWPGTTVTDRAPG